MARAGYRSFPALRWATLNCSVIMMITVVARTRSIPHCRYEAYGRWSAEHRTHQRVERPQWHETEISI
ncbi:hypothetical protein BIFGAL_02797 [Bifidobacterium gallicum DSM 20093 = LMG 11596]|uniref:Uncharacterized protein n=1 Tax=Bifidobacterium gallicum DSM 20093 = LMG 11596 TaxID=561180 RepID=D1NSN8_9BIFI|nr:hypothetical protein BIFGAL_02797 [Bifidobacterium gallicum DSM 20093 = LMG 11596]